MTGNRVERRLAAILAADVAGYSRLTGLDEEGTHVRLRERLRGLADPRISEHRGKVVKHTGDGVLAEFGSVVDAVRCAIEVQRGMAEQNATMPQVKRIEFRIGIHVGDIIVDDNDIFGDGVNIAARLEGIAEPGGVCISDDAQRQVRGKVDFAFEDMGPQNLKNIVEPMRAWRLRMNASGSPAAPIEPPVESTQALALPDKPSIAVLPFANMSGDPEQEYFADGMVEEITTALSRFKWLFVIARNSSSTFKGKAVDIKEVGRRLGVRYVLEGAVRKASGKVRITCQLIEAATGAHIWADRFERDMTDIFALQATSRSPLSQLLSQSCFKQKLHWRRGGDRKTSPPMIIFSELCNRRFLRPAKGWPRHSDWSSAPWSLTLGLLLRRLWQVTVIWKTCLGATRSTHNSNVRKPFASCAWH